MKPTRHQCIWVVLLVLLAACGQQTIALPTETPIPTVGSPTRVPTSTSIPVTVTPSPMPTEPIIPIIAPDPVQVERWNEYEDALAIAFFKSYYQPEEVVCEWVILGQTDQEVYVWAHCASIYSAGPSQGSIPTVIRIGANGSVQNAEIPGSGTAYGPSIRRLFPPDLQEIIFDHSVLFSQEQMDRLRWRRGHPDEPPWIVFSVIPTQSTPTLIPMNTPEPIQVERWGEYQTVLAGQLDYRPPENILCEWELLGRSGNEVYVWAICGEILSHRLSLESLVVIYTLDDGSVAGALRSEDRSMFPLDVQQKYFGGLIHFQELVDHLRWRQRHPEEPPLIVLSATPIP